MREEGKMEVWVVTGGDFPIAVFSTEEAAKAYVDPKEAENQERRRVGQRVIHWRIYHFEVNYIGN
jgi:hypothetical protein